MAWHKSNPDDRSDNVEKLQQLIQSTEENIHKAEESIAHGNAQDKAAIEAKNDRRRESIHAFKSEVQDEAHQQNDLT